MSSSSYIHKVAIVGAAGQQGKHIVSALLNAGRHTVTAVTREDSTNTDIAPGVQVKKVNYEDEDSLVSALKGQDCLIITMSVQAPPDTSAKLIKAAAKAGVPWILPNEWGSNYDNEGPSNDVFIGVGIRKNRALIEELGVSNWIAVACSFWYQYSLGTMPTFYGFDFQNKSVTFYDDGAKKINTSTWEQTALAVSQLLALPIKTSEPNQLSLEKDFKNKYVYINSFNVSQKDIFESVKRVTGTIDGDWKINYQPSKERYEEGLKEYQGGNQLGFAKLLYARMFYPDIVVPPVMNDTFNLPKEDLDHCTKGAIERSEKMAASRKG